MDGFVDVQCCFNDDFDRVLAVLTEIDWDVI